MWNSGTRSIDDAFYRRPAWKKCRSAYIAYRKSQDGGLCERCHEHTGRIIVTSCIDNLTKGAAGQAIQCMNIRFGIDEAEGLL